METDKVCKCKRSGCMHPSHVKETFGAKTPYDHLKHSHDIEALMLALKEKFGLEKRHYGIAFKVEVGYSVGCYRTPDTPNDFCVWIDLEQSNKDHPDYPFVGFNRTSLHRALKAFLFYPTPVLEGDPDYD